MKALTEVARLTTALLLVLPLAGCQGISPLAGWTQRGPLASQDKVTVVSSPAAGRALPSDDAMQPQPVTLQAVEDDTNPVTTSSRRTAQQATPSRTEEIGHEARLDNALTALGLGALQVPEGQEEAPTQSKHLTHAPPLTVPQPLADRQPAEEPPEPQDLAGAIAAHMELATDAKDAVSAKPGGRAAGSPALPAVTAQPAGLTVFVEDSQEAEVPPTVAGSQEDAETARPPGAPPADKPTDESKSDKPAAGAEPLPLGRLEETPAKDAMLAACDCSTLYPIDLANALAMGGANHLQVQMARERLIEAHADYDLAKALWLPSIRLGIVYNKHDGRLQATDGNVGEFPRNSLFVGGGAGLGGAPLAGGSGGPARLFVNLSLADAIFEKHVAARLVDAYAAAEVAAVNDAQLQIAQAYFDLVEAYGLLANAQVGQEMGGTLLKLATDFADEGKGAVAEVDRAQTAHTRLHQAREDARRRTVSASAELLRLLRLEPCCTLAPADEKVVPVDFVDCDCDCSALVCQAVSSRPEIAHFASKMDARAEQLLQENWRPWLPHLVAGASGGTFGGGPGTTFDNDGSRSDVDLAAIWEVRNLGFGNTGLVHKRAAQTRRAEAELAWMRDRVTAEVVKAHADVSSFAQQMKTARAGAAAAADSYRRNHLRVKSGEGLPLELLQSLRARVEALNAYTSTVASYNRAQFRLLRAVGTPPVAEAP